MRTWFDYLGEYIGRVLGRSWTLAVGLLDMLAMLVIVGVGGVATLTLALPVALGLLTFLVVVSGFSTFREERRERARLEALLDERGRRRAIAARLGAYAAEGAHVLFLNPREVTSAAEKWTQQVSAYLRDEAPEHEAIFEAIRINGQRDVTSKWVRKQLDLLADLVKSLAL